MTERRLTQKERVSLPYSYNVEFKSKQKNGYTLTGEVFDWLTGRLIEDSLIKIKGKISSMSPDPEDDKPDLNHRRWMSAQGLLFTDVIKLSKNLHTKNSNLSLIFVCWPASTLKSPLHILHELSPKAAFRLGECIWF